MHTIPSQKAYFLLSRFNVTLPASAWLFAALMLLTGCGHFRPSSSAEYVYVVTPTFLRDRVAIVANHVADVKNSERLQVLEHGRRFLKVKTPEGTVGWIEDPAVIDQSEFDTFQNLARQYVNQQPVANAVLYADQNVHIAPGRKTQHFYVFPANTQVAMLERASVARAAPASVLGLPTAAAKPHAMHANDHAGKPSNKNFLQQFLPAVPMEDWWLVRDVYGHTGWVLARNLQVDVPNDVAQYAENEKMVGAYMLRTVEDPDSGKPGGKVPEYLTVLTPYKEGLPFDFDQVRVFTWDTRRHRYGTAFRQRDVAGFFPVKVTPGDASSAPGPVPVFSFQIAAGNAASLDPQTGTPHATQLETLTYRMEGNLVRRVLPPGAKSVLAEHSMPGHRKRRSRHAKP